MNGTDDMKDLIHREIQSIPGLAERVAFKDMMEGVFLALYEKNEEMYRNLETRVMDDLAYNINRYQVRTGLVERQYLDLSHHLMAPVCQEDVEAVRYTAGEIMTNLFMTEPVTKPGSGKILRTKMGAQFRRAKKIPG